MCSRRLTWSNYHLLQGRKGDSGRRTGPRSHSKLKGKMKGLESTTPTYDFSHCSSLAFVFRGPGDAKIPLEGL